MNHNLTMFLLFSKLELVFINQDKRNKKKQKQKQSYEIDFPKHLFRLKQKSWLFFQSSNMLILDMKTMMKASQDEIEPHLFKSNLDKIQTDPYKKKRCAKIKWNHILRLKVKSLSSNILYIKFTFQFSIVTKYEKSEYIIHEEWSI